MRLQMLGVLFLLWMQAPLSPPVQTLTVWHTPPQTTAQAAFIREWQVSLAQQGIEAQFVVDDADAVALILPAQAVLQVTFTEGDSVWQVQAGLLASVSPLLYDTLIPERLAITPALLTDALRYSAYTIGDCTPLDTDDLSIPQAFMASNCLLAAGALPKASAALEGLQSQVGFVPSYQRMASHLAWLDLQTRDLDTAVARFTPHIAALDAQSTEYDAGQHVALLADLAHVYALGFDYDSAIAHITEALLIAESAELATSDLAQLYKQRGDHIFLLYEWDRVLTDYNRAIELNPTYSPAYYARGVLYYTQGPRPRALQDFEQFLTLVPTDAPQREAAQRYIVSIQQELEALEGGDIGGFGVPSSSSDE